MKIFNLAKKWFKLGILRMNDKIAYMLVLINLKCALKLTL